MGTIFHYSCFSPDPHGNGALRRSAQIKKLLNELDFSYQRLNPIKVRRLTTSPLKILLSIKNGYKFKKKYRLKIKGITDYLYYGKLLDKLTNSFQESSLVAWELSRYSNYYYPFVLKNLGIKLIGFPHNIESLVPQQRSFLTKKLSPDWFDEEIKLLKIFDIVFTISKEEAWLLKLLGINAYYLPYVPSTSVQKDLLNVRSERKSSKKDFLLLLGTIDNPPTYEGMLEVIRYYNNSNESVQIKIGGFGTESLLKKKGFPNNIEILGTLTNEQLIKSLIGCKALLVNQMASSGALTKLIEMQYAGVPVLANDVSLRNYYNIKGFYTYYRIQDIGKLYYQNLETPSFPSLNESSENILSFQLSTLNSKGPNTHQD